MARQVQILEDLGLMLLEKKLITQNQLQEAREQHRIKGGYLAQHLVELGYLKESDLTACLTCRYGFAYMPLKSYKISESARKVIHEDFARAFYILPIEKDKNVLTVTMAYPLNKGVLELLKEITRCEIVIFISTPHEIKEAFERHFNAPLKEYDLDSFRNDPALRDNLKEEEEYEKRNAASSRRRYKRISTRIKGRRIGSSKFDIGIFNVSMSGILFRSNAFLPQGTQMAMNIALGKNKIITAVIEVARVTTKKRRKLRRLFSKKKAHEYYETGAFFNFISEKDQIILSEFLKKKIKH